MHDDYIVGYSVNLEEKDMVIQTYNDNTKKLKKICFSEVLTHCFKCIIDYNIISDICECEISSFVKDNQEELIKMEGYCWPIDYQTEQELIEFLVDNEYKYIKINSSYGMFGWILAKSYKITK
ncbi:MAG: hypothetical protein IIT46_11095 [Lachnospiraceae bacterium]|nr:hypothetical protein [Lachnospiraceae bacterium]